MSSGGGLHLFFNPNVIPCGPPAAPPPEVGPASLPVIRNSTAAIAPNNSTTSLAIVVPAHVPGDLLVWVVGDTASAGIMNNPPPAGWAAPLGNQGTAGGNASLLIWTRIATSSEPFSYTASGTLYPTMVMMAIANSSGSTTPAAISYATQLSDSVLRTPALSAPVYLLIGAYCWGSTFGLDELVQTSSLILDQSQTGYPGQAVGMWIGHVQLWGASAPRQVGTLHEAVNWRAGAIAIGP
jgi:hypothetical protein